MGSPFEPMEEPQEQFCGRLIRITTQKMKLQNGKEVTFEKAERSPGVRILVTDESRMLMTKEWRTENNDWDYRLPGGKVCDSLDEYVQAMQNDMDELAKNAAKKELEEETSLNLPIESFEQIHHSVCGATIVWDLYYFLVKLPKDEVKELDSITTHEGEETHPQWLSFEEVKKLCVDGNVKEDRTVSVVLRFLASKS
ncbi:MAG: NUDIX domain-containing protein [Candidatus Peribacteraceae bacterium]|jgi:8-oxo-dGTP pyrophosphatase MutT (NUDIX family)|nr:NUDIX domain-containing protein [Candidatus Peribacteraceae bacterium]|tara:strand:- start:1426 stop:2016 length:591 start_codon:yes stop_codon:yes gene_type:complete